jgi:glycosyltransferase involved in cell wall biosynthesis
MKLLVINNDKGWGGGQEFLADLSGELRKYCIEVHIVARAGSPSEQKFKGLGMTTYPMPRKGIKDLKAILKLASIMRKEQFDVISINREHDLFCTVLASFLAFPFSRPGKLIMTYHIGVARRQLFLGAMDAVLCVSEHVRTSLLRFHPQVASKTQIIHNGIRLSNPPSAEKFTTNREKLFFQGVGFPIIGMVGAFWKNQAELVDCIPFLKDEFPGIKVAFVGDNTEVNLTACLIEKIQKLKLEDSVVFTGKVPRERLADVFFDLDLSVTTHRNEGFGIVHLESLAAGTPVVAYREGGQVDILDNGVVGILVKGGGKEFAVEVAGLLRDHDRRFTMGAKGYALVKNKFSVEVMAENYRSCFRRLLLGEKTA